MMNERVKTHTKNIMLFFLIALLSTFLQTTPVVVSGGPENDYEGWIARLSDNRLMVIFTRNPDWASGDLYVTFSTDDGASWDSVLPIIVENGDQATLSFIQLPNDTLCLWYASNEDGQYGIYEARSADGLSWSRQGRVELGWSHADMFYDPTLILEPDSSLTMSYRGPGGAYIAHCPYGGDWDTLKTMVGAGGYRPRVMKHTNGTYLYVYHRNTGSGYEVFSRTSTDRVTWSNEVQLTFHGNSHDPFPNQAPDPKYLVYYATYVPPAYNLYRRASSNGVDWETEYQITADISNNTQPHFFIETNEVYLLWAHAVNYPNDHDVYFERTTYFGVQDTDIESTLHSAVSMEIYPNPSVQKINILLTAKQTEEIKVSLYDVQGQMIGQPIRKTINKMCSFHINTAHLSNGTYFVKVDYTKGACFKKFIVVR